MRIAIIGAGMIGGTMARLLTRVGHEVAISNQKGPDAIHDLLAEANGAHWAPTEEAARWGEIVLLAVPFRTPEALPSADAVAGKIVIDAMNPYAADGGFIDLGDSTSSEETALRLPGARIVKAFNTIFFRHLATEGRTDLPEGDRRAIFIAGDDQDAKRVVADLIRQLGFAPVDTGALRDGGRRQQPGSVIYNRQISANEARALLANK
jgi:predicted dinucleotide-binding enzyme